MNQLITASTPATTSSSLAPVTRQKPAAEFSGDGQDRQGEAQPREAAEMVHAAVPPGPDRGTSEPDAVELDSIDPGSTSRSSCRAV